MAIVDACEARIARSSALVEQKMMRLRPSEAVIEADLYRLMCSALLCVRIGKQQDVFLFAFRFVVDSQQAAVAVRFNERVTIRRVRLPSLAQVACREDRSKSFGVVSHVEHQRSVTELYRLAFAAVDVGRSADRPSRTVIAAGYDGRELLAFLVASLRGHHERAVGELNSLLRRGSEQPPRFLLQRASQVLWLRPSEPIVARTDHQKLGALADLEAWL